MRENPSHLRYNDIYTYIFYERTDHFTRYDIINRILNSLRELYRDFIAIYIIDHNEVIKSIICRRITCFNLLSSDLDSLVNILHMSFRDCNEVLTLEEKGTYDLEMLCHKKCFLLGLHKTSDLEHVIKLFNMSSKIVSLGEISYLTSQCVKIMGYIKNVLCRENGS